MCIFIMDPWFLFSAFNYMSQVKTLGGELIQVPVWKGKTTLRLRKVKTTLRLRKVKTTLRLWKV